jgi:hypothetical protein
MKNTTARSQLEKQRGGKDANKPEAKETAACGESGGKVESQGAVGSLAAKATHGVTSTEGYFNFPKWRQAPRTRVNRGSIGKSWVRRDFQKPGCSDFGHSLRRLQSLAQTDK